MEGTHLDEVFRELQVTFEQCMGSDCKSVADTEAYLKDKKFKFPFRQSFFNLYSDGLSIVVEEINDKLIVPFLTDFKLDMTIELEQGIIDANSDITGLSYLMGDKSLERFFLVGDVQKVYHPRQNDA